ncbi:MAG: hypothetical protein A2921_00930 [Candidatus Magasanikbacteria bacterium RIFCSPLOWO2_01_FULL_43_20b]|uniref:HicB-like antitoxin of toxin-antitoxin system domain-containing protein n=1 Tax=Candidatus Magasanikbacteria bacterium RIFCSPLOWO2_12_FULL_43_12 TaxID=1798692 RepID=A0A1F6MQI6_9BACT|nr:MAG: hypothetical protein A3I93_02825 [Candidatus Magasanikbacteria bacterium RIFCSPLOWO2_02_FULL_43_22]OGH73108.1 MAG: hypothetical protein A2921_00930 [Candidatus Magasanikbacteria bacterium RIFCSPLOWO2_01_FULL_43_20b]OGH73929.1 MAG: hypothetical protein A3G00_03415 [Candidatus Magasanikbacteria bacterium RIFCSPLOWO2_12_FULL_43_12]OGT21055.1 MAG: hypothetical protein A3C55_01150 [Gammaproteobacteria bacterium RIFCSPHIGHO2_02_FULL_42_13]
MYSHYRLLTKLHLNGVTSQGEGLEDAEKNLREAIELYLEDAPAEEFEKFVEHPLPSINKKSPIGGFFSTLNSQKF